MVIQDKDIARLRQLLGEINRAEQAKRKLVLRLRDNGATWTEIGYALNTSAQAAQKRFGNSSEREVAHKEASVAKALKRVKKAAKKPPTVPA